MSKLAERFQYLKNNIQHYEYCGGGYFRDKRVKKGATADIIHAPELIDLIKELLQNV